MSLGSGSILDISSVSYDSSNLSTYLVISLWSSKAKFKEDFPGKKYYVGRAGTTISVHLGPGGVAFSVIRKN